MTLSALQKYILLQSYGRDKKVSRKIFNHYYSRQSKVDDNIVKIITKSLERLIGKGLLVGFGEVTKEKWFINEVRLTPAGRRTVKKLMGTQAKLPFRNSKF